jgi:peptidylprolyl isomerase domain and WD repeat-containing protein 1
MHRDQLCYVNFTQFTEFLITSSIDGVVKFWKKATNGIEFVKEFKAHTGEINSVSVSADGRSFATGGADNSVKIFDVITFGGWNSIFLCAHELMSLSRPSRNAATGCNP